MPPFLTFFLYRDLCSGSSECGDDWEILVVRPRNYDEQRRRRRRDAPRREEEGKREKEGWCAGDAKRRRREQEEEEGLRRKREMKAGIDGDWPRAGGAKELLRNLSGQRVGVPRQGNLSQARAERIAGHRD